MRPLRRNGQKMLYSLYLGSLYEVPTDGDGNPLYHQSDDGSRIYMTNGEPLDIYGTPVAFQANFSEAGGEAEAMEYGLSVGDYEGIIFYAKNAYPIKEGSIVWKDSEVEYEDEKKYYTKDMSTLIEVHTPKKESADFTVRKTPDSLNFTRAIVKAINK